MAELKASVQGLRGLGFRVWVSEFRVLQLFRARDACCKRVLGVWGLGVSGFGCKRLVGEFWGFRVQDLIRRLGLRAR